MRLSKRLPEAYYIGSVKSCHDFGDGTLAFRWTDGWSAFDVGTHQQEIPGKGLAVCATAVKAFEIAGVIGVPTHFVEQLDELTIRVKKCRVITDRDLKKTEDNYAVPAEFIFRFAVAGSIDRDFREGKKFPMDYGFATNDPPKVGTSFVWPVHMFHTKFEVTDREIDEVETRRMAGLSVQDLAQYWSMIDYLNGGINLAFAKAGFGRLDGKVECGMGPNRQKMIIDVFATGDEDRPVLLDKLKQGEVVHYGKEALRQRLIEMGYFDVLKAARKAGHPDPPYPDIEQSFIDEVAQRYRDFATAFRAVEI